MVASTTTSTRCATEPVWSLDRGCKVGTGDWRLVVERLNGSGSVVGACVVGSSPTGDAVVGSLQWEDLTYWLRGMEWFRGADEPFGRPRVGEINLTFTNADSRFTPWSASYADTRPGVVMRAGLVSNVDARASGWIPLWCGIVDSWAPSFHGVRTQSTVFDAGGFAEAEITVTLVETLSTLARVDNNSTALVGSGDMASTRLNRLLAAAVWKFGVAAYTLGVAESIPLQSTDMSANRLTEIYLTADSAAYVARSDVTGAFVQTDIPRYSYIAPSARLVDFSTDGVATEPLLGFRPHTEDFSTSPKHLLYDAETLVIVSDPQHIVNDHRYTRVGGTQQVVEHKVSIGRFGRSSRQRNDLISTADANALAVAKSDNRREARTTIRIDELTVTATGKGEYYLLVAVLDIGNWVRVTVDEASSYLTGVTRSMLHSVTPLSSGQVQWTATFAVDTADLVGFPDGAILDPLP